MKVLRTLYLFVVINVCKSEFFSSVYHMESLVDTEKYLIDTVEFFLAEEEKLVNDLKMRLKNLKKNHGPASIEPIEYLSNPVNEYLLMKRLFMEWKEIEEEVTLGPIKLLKENYQYLTDNHLLPTSYDLGGAAEGIFRLQETYDIDAKTFAAGKFDGIETEAEMSGRDCFDIGFQAFNGQNYDRSSEWLLEAYRRAKQENGSGVNWIGLLDALENSLFQIGETEQALHYTNELLEMAPDYKKAKVDRHKYESILYPDQNVLGYEISQEDGRLVEDPFNYDQNEFMRYIRVCRGQQQQSLSEQAKLNCYFSHEPHPVLRIGPVKVEEVHLHPYVVVFHDVLYDTEIQQMINVSKHELHRSQVVSDSYGEGMVGEYRVSQNTGIDSKKHPFLAKVDQRIEIITGLSTISSEGHQVANYGIGGHYEPHLDFSSKYGDTPLDYWDRDGNRIATLVFYLTDVLKGGATAFPYLDTKVPARKGTALFWYNLYKDGEGNYLTRHAACPVLLGNKWSNNVWLRERGQEFKRPCELQPDHEPDEVWISLLGQ